MITVAARVNTMYCFKRRLIPRHTSMEWIDPPIPNENLSYGIVFRKCSGEIAIINELKEAKDHIEQTHEVCHRSHFY